jgi:hypothetical protein
LHKLGEKQHLEKGEPMFGHMKAQPILTLRIGYSLEEALARLMEATEGAQVVRWVEFPVAILLFLAVVGDAQSGAFYVLDRKVGTWFWVDFVDEQYGGYSVGDFDLLVHEYDILSFVERPALLRATSGWFLEPHRPAQLAAQPCK